MSQRGDSVRASLSRQGEALCAALDDVEIGAAHLTPDGAWLAVNRRFCQILDLSIDEVRARPVADLLGNTRTDHTPTTTPARSTGFQITRKDGTAGWIRSRLSAVRDPETGEVRSLFLVIDDATAAKPREGADRRDDPAEKPDSQVAGRLINSLEAERSRIARELHDDIGQSLAVLVVQMLRAGKPVSGTVGRSHPGISDLAAGLQAIASRVSRLSHELHSSRLEYLGLEKAVRGACREFSEGHQTAVECECDSVPAELQADVALCILRVVQEALHNVAKHSRATKVNVTLRSGSTDLVLVVADDGIGFDVSEVGLAEGIGLISMRERVRFVGGSFALSSEPGRGTRIEARVPQAAAAR